MKIEKITIVTPSLPYANLVSRTVMVEYGVPMIATVVRNAGYDVKLYAEHIAPIDWRRVMESDLVCFHAFSSTMPKVIQHTARVREQRPDMPIIIGGVHASVMAEDTLQYCDFVVRQEGDETLPELLDVLKNDGDVSNVLGISYMVNGEFPPQPQQALCAGLQHHPRHGAGRGVHVVDEQLQAPAPPKDRLERPSDQQRLPLRLLVLHRPL